MPVQRWEYCRLDGRQIVYYTLNGTEVDNRFNTKKPKEFRGNEEEWLNMQKAIA